MQALRAELSKMFDDNGSLNSEAILEKSREFDELVMTHYRRRRDRAQKVVAKARMRRAIRDVKKQGRRPK
jgi:hypothetical protein